MTPRPVVSKIDRIGLALVALFLAWVGFVALLTERSPWAAIATIVLSTAAYALGRAGTRLLASWLIPAVIMLLASAVYLQSPAGTLSNLSSQGFLGYANAKSAFFVQAAFATAMIVAGTRTALVGVLSLPAFALFVMVPIHARSLGGFMSSVLLLPALIVAAFGQGRRAAIVLAAVVALGGVTTSFALAAEFASGRDSDMKRRIAERMDPGRAAVWADSYRLIRDHPVLGVGPGGFGENSPTAAEERDLRWAHNEFLQQGAETGLIGFALLAGLVAWLFWRLWNAGTAAAAVAALAVSSLVIHACAEYLFHFPLLPAITAALAGSVSSPAHRGLPASRPDNRAKR